MTPVQCGAQGPTPLADAESEVMELFKLPLAVKQARAPARAQHWHLSDSEQGSDSDAAAFETDSDRPGGSPSSTSNTASVGDVTT